MYESSGNLFKVDQPIVMGFPDGLDDKESACNMGDPGLIPGSGRSREGTGSPLQDSCLENPMGRGAWWATATHTHTHITVTHYTHTECTSASVYRALQTNPQNLESGPTVVIYYSCPRSSYIDLSLNSTNPSFSTYCKLPLLLPSSQANKNQNNLKI